MIQESRSGKRARMMRRWFNSALAACVLAGGAGMLVPAPARAVEQLTLSHFLPDFHPLHRSFLAPWARDVESCSEGEVKITLHSAGSEFGDAAKQLDQVRSGTVSIAHGLTGIPAGRLPRTMIIDIPFLTRNAAEASRTLWSLYEDGHIATEYRGLKVLALHAQNPGMIHTKGVRVSALSDLKGLRISHPGKMMELLLRHVGADPVSLSPTEVLPGLERGLIDGTASSWEAVNGYKLYKQLDHHWDVKAFTTSFFFVMNKRRYESLSAKVRACIDHYSGEGLVRKLGGLWNAWDRPGLERSFSKGDEIITMTDADRMALLEQVRPVITSGLDYLRRQGVADPESLYQAAQETVNRIRAMPDDK